MLVLGILPAALGMPALQDGVSVVSLLALIILLTIALSAAHRIATWRALVAALPGTAGLALRVGPACGQIGALHALAGRAVVPSSAAPRKQGRSAGSGEDRRFVPTDEGTKDSWSSLVF